NDVVLTRSPSRERRCTHVRSGRLEIAAVAAATRSASAVSPGRTRASMLARSATTGRPAQEGECGKVASDGGHHADADENVADAASTSDPAEHRGRHGESVARGAEEDEGEVVGFGGDAVPSRGLHAVGTGGGQL